MKVPKHLRKRMDEAVRAANLVNFVDCEVHQWCKKHGIDPDDCSDDQFIWSNHVSILTEPEAHRSSMIHWIESK